MLERTFIEIGMAVAAYIATVLVRARAGSRSFGPAYAHAGVTPKNNKPRLRSGD
jgi:hypothetical protein